MLNLFGGNTRNAYLCSREHQKQMNKKGGARHRYNKTMYRFPRRRPKQGQYIMYQPSWML